MDDFTEEEKIDYIFKELKSQKIWKYFKWFFNIFIILLVVQIYYNIIPNLDNNNNIINYVLTKREIVTNGVTKTLKRTISESDVRPFFEVILPEDNVLSINSIITLEGTNITSNLTLSQLYDEEKRWWLFRRIDY